MSSLPFPHRSMLRRAPRPGPPPGRCWTAPRRPGCWPSSNKPAASRRATTPTAATSVSAWCCGRAGARTASAPSRWPSRCGSTTPSTPRVTGLRRAGCFWAGMWLSLRTPTRCWTSTWRSSAVGPSASSATTATCDSNSPTCLWGHTPAGDARCFKAWRRGHRCTAAPRRSSCWKPRRTSTWPPRSRG